MTEFEVGYLAGIIDGEGSIALYSRGERSGRRRPVPVITIVSTDRELLEYIAALVGRGSIRARKTDNPNWKQCFQLRWRGLEDIYRICSLIDGRVIIKRGQVDIMLTFIGVRKALCGRHDSKWSPEETFDEEFALMERMRLLNQRGPHPKELTPKQADFLRGLELVEE